MEGRQLRFAFLATLALLPVLLFGHTNSIAPIRKNAHHIVAHLIDLNRAEAAELTLIPGIGPRLAERIVRYREKHGPFRSLHGLEAVKGIGPKKAEAFRTWVIIDGNGAFPSNLQEDDGI
jgi:competence protein ComEA